MCPRTVHKVIRMLRDKKVHDQIMLRYIRVYETHQGDSTHINTPMSTRCLLSISQHIHISTVPSSIQPLLPAVASITNQYPSIVNERTDEFVECPAFLFRGPWITSFCGGREEKVGTRKLHF